MVYEYKQHEKHCIFGVSRSLERACFIILIEGAMSPFRLRLPHTRQAGSPRNVSRRFFNISIDPHTTRMLLLHVNVPFPNLPRLLRLMELNRIIDVTECRAHTVLIIDVEL
jgi:hypothetical protein